MDVRQLLNDRLDRIPPGDHLNGLKAVRLHVEAAIRHFERGQREGDEAAFTDSIYRCNQAFEGSVKEAYRVLSSKNPDNVTLAEIETYMTSGGVLRKKVLDQFTNYRKEWRNPSTHNYMLDFDEDEALLAIVSVVVFSIVLCDQIESKLAFAAVQLTTSATTLPPGSLLDQAAEIVKRFAEGYFIPTTDLPPPQISYERVEGALGGFLAVEFARRNVRVVQNARVDRFEVDVILESAGQTVAVELKVMRRKSNSVIDHAVLRLDELVRSQRVSGGVALILVAGANEYQISHSDPPFDNTEIKVVRPVERK